jgi:hypothetical protein
MLRRFFSFSLLLRCLIGCTTYCLMIRISLGLNPGSAGEGSGLSQRAIARSSTSTTPSIGDVTSATALSWARVAVSDLPPTTPPSLRRR